MFQKSSEVAHLHVAKLRERLVAVIQAADEGLETLVSLLVCSNIATLGKLATALATGVGSLASVAAHMGLEVAQLREGELASREFASLDVSVSPVPCCTSVVQTYIGLGTGVRAAVDVKMGLLGEALLAVWAVANVSLLGCLGIRRGWGAVVLKASLRDRRHAWGEWLLCDIQLLLSLALDGLHQLIHLGLEVDLVIRVDSLVGGDGLGAECRVVDRRPSSGGLGVASCRRGRLLSV